MNNTEKKGRDALFTRPTVPLEKREKIENLETQKLFFKEKYTQHTYRVPAAFDEKVRNLHYSTILATGNTDYKLVDLYINALELFIKKSKIEIRPRPDNVREKEKYHGRGACRKNRPKGEYPISDE